MRWPLIILAVLFAGCYNQQKAQKQFGRAGATYPAIPAAYCATTYPVKERVIQGKDSIVTDTLWGAGEVIRDTIYNKDTVFIYRTERIPGSVITNTVYKTDTIIKEDAAKWALCNIERGKVIDLLKDKTTEAEQWKRKAKKRFWIIAAMGAAMLIGLFFTIKKKLYAVK